MSGGDHLKVICEIGIQTLLAFFSIWFITRILGRKQIAQLTVYEYINGITFGSIAATLATDLNQRTWHHLIGLFLFGILTWGMSYISFKNDGINQLLQGEPVIVIEDGKILEKNLKRCLYSINDLLEQLRLEKIFDIKEVKYAIVETNGALSVMKYEHLEVPTVQDLGLVTSPKAPFCSIILDGKIIKDNMRLMKIDEDWLFMQLKAKGIQDIKEVMYAAVNQQKEIYIDVYKDHAGGGEKTPL